MFWPNIDFIQDSQWNKRISRIYKQQKPKEYSTLFTDESLINHRSFFTHESVLIISSNFSPVPEPNPPSASDLSIDPCYLSSTRFGKVLTARATDAASESDCRQRCHLTRTLHYIYDWRTRVHRKHPMRQEETLRCQETTTRH